MAPLRYAFQAIRMMLFLLIALSILFLLNHFRLSAYFPIQTVRVYGVKHSDRQDMQDTLTPFVSRGFFEVQVEMIRDRMLQMPWVQDILVSREWPDKINITVVEKEALASWNDHMLMSTEGNIFEPAKSTYPKNLPHFYAPLGKQVVVLQYYRNMNKILAPLHASVAELEMTPYLNWKIKLDNGVALQAGQKDIFKRLAHLVEIYPQIIGERAGDVEYIDLRYPNGVAVRWREAIKT